jgi:hypothetical protein
VSVRFALQGAMALACLAVNVRPATAQWAAPWRTGAVRDVADIAPASGAALRGLGAHDAAHALARRAGGLGRDDAERRRWAPVASLIVPGAGQALLHQDRFVAYLAVEAWAVVEFANQRTEARRQQNRYRGLARDVARSLYGPTFPVGTGEYYEWMEKFLESGVFDRLPGGEVDPDINSGTYNGAIWLLARTTYWNDPNVSPSTGSPEYRRAMNFYLDRAIRPEFRWSWRSAQLEQDLFIRTIRRSNTSFREARSALGIVLANHLLSSVDAFVTLRVEGLEGSAGRGFAVRGSLPIR